ncbi:MAG: hypothetical protein, partial [Olavius algarvensis Gamma 1 endosymbiont]
ARPSGTSDGYRLPAVANSSEPQRRKGIMGRSLIICLRGLRRFSQIVSFFIFSSARICV